MVLVIAVALGFVRIYRPQLNKDGVESAAIHAVAGLRGHFIVDRVTFWMLSESFRRCCARLVRV